MMSGAECACSWCEREMTKVDGVVEDSRGVRPAVIAVALVAGVAITAAALIVARRLNH